jgi:hypothetical protein
MTTRPASQAAVAEASPPELHTRTLVLRGSQPCNFVFEFEFFTFETS